VEVTIRAGTVKFFFGGGWSYTKNQTEKAHTEKMKKRSYTEQKEGGIYHQAS